MAGNDNSATAQEIAAPAIAMRLGVPGEDGRMFELTAYIDRDSSQSEIDHLADKMRKAADRQRAISQLPQLRHELDGHVGLYETNRKEAAAEKAKLKEQKAIYHERRRELTGSRDRAMDAARDDYIASGRRGEWKPRGHLAGDVKRIDAELKQIDDAERKAEQEHEVALSQIENMVQKNEMSVLILRRRIDECEALVRGDDIHGIKDE